MPTPHLRPLPPGASVFTCHACKKTHSADRRPSDWHRLWMVEIGVEFQSIDSYDRVWAPRSEMANDYCDECSDAIADFIDNYTGPNEETD